MVKWFLLRTTFTHHLTSTINRYVSVLVELTGMEGTKHGALIADQLLDVTVRVLAIRHFSVSQMVSFVAAFILLSIKSSFNEFID